MNRELISVIMDSAKLIKMMKSLDKTDKRVDSAEFYTNNAIHWLGNFLSKVFYKLTLEEMCEMAGLEFVRLDMRRSLVAFKTEKDQKEAFLVWTEWNDDNKGLITFSIQDFQLHESFRSVCLCDGCCNEERIAFFVNAARTHGIKRVFARIKRAAFEKEDVIFEEITKFPVLTKIEILL